MKKILVMTVLMMSTSAFADSFLEGDWCGLTWDAQDKLVRTTDFTNVLSITEGGSFEAAVVANETGDAQARSYMSGYISQGASGADMQPDLGPKFQEADLDDSGNLKLMFVDGTVNRYASCEDAKFVNAVEEASRELSQ